MLPGLRASGALATAAVAEATTGGSHAVARQAAVSSGTASESSYFLVPFPFPLLELMYIEYLNHEQYTYPY